MRTRSRSLCLWALLILCGAAAAPAGAVPVIAGAKAGYTNTDLVGSNDGGIGTKNSALMGLMFGWKIAPWFAVQFEPDVTQKGAHLTGYSFGDLPTSVRFTYVEMPVLAKFLHSFSGDAREGIFGIVGPSLGVRTHATGEFAGSETNINDLVSGVDLGLALGAGYDIPAGNWVTTIEVRYIFGLTDAFDSSAPRPEVTGDLKNRALQITVGAFKRIF